MDLSGYAWVFPALALLVLFVQFIRGLMGGPRDWWLRVALAFGSAAGSMSLAALGFMYLELLGVSNPGLSLVFMVGLLSVAFSILVMTAWNMYMCESGQLQVAGVRRETILFACERARVSAIMALVSFMNTFFAMLIASDLAPRTIRSSTGALYYDISHFFLYTGTVSLGFLLLSFMARRTIATTREERLQKATQTAQPLLGTSRAQLTLQREERKEIRESSLMYGSILGLTSLVLLFFVPASLNAVSFSIAFNLWFFLTLVVVYTVRGAPLAYLVTLSSDLLSFYCPRCKQKIEPFERSGDLLERFIYGKLSLRQAQERVIISHYRHFHTEYEKELRELKRARSTFIDKEQRREELKREYSEKARRLAVQDGLLKE